MKTIIIAEAGVNHNGSVNLAKELIDVASDAGADYIKFQTFKTELNISKNAIKANYQIENTNDAIESQYEMVKKLELSFDDFITLKEYCVSKKIDFLSTPFDIPSIDFLSSIGMPFFKIPSGEITNKRFLQNIARKGKPIILSTGMSDLEEIKNAVKIITDEGLTKENITVLHCNTEYPTLMADVNLKAMNTIQKELRLKVGYSDHTLGIEVAIAAVALGAVVIEKHFTIDRNLQGPDHKASLEPDELKNMIIAIRNVEQAMAGDGIKESSISEMKNKSIARKSIHLSRSLHKGSVLTETDLIALRPGDGISAIEWDTVIGKKLKENKSAFDKLTWKDII